MSASDERLEVRDGGSRDQSRSGSGRGGLDTMPRPADGDPLPSASRGGSGSSSGFSGGGNPFVASKEDSTTPLAGSGVLDDIEGIATGLKEGSWLDVGMSTLAMGADVLGAVVDPLGTLIAWGAGWLIEHFNPMKGWLEQLAGDADQVKANAQTWGNVAEAMGGLAEDLEMDAKGLMADARGAAAMGYLAANGDVSKSLRTAGKAAAAMSGALGVLATVVKVVHDLVRDAIANIIGTLASAIIEAVVTVGFAIPAIIAQVQIKVGAKAAEMGAKITGLLKSAKSLFKQLTSLKGLLELLKSLLKKGKQGLKGLKDLGKKFLKGKKGTDLKELVKSRKRMWTAEKAEKRAKKLIEKGKKANARKKKYIEKIEKRGLSTSDVSASNCNKTLRKMRKKGKSIFERKMVQWEANRLSKARVMEKRASEDLGQLGAEYAANNFHPPRHVIPGVGGSGAGNRRFDVLAVDERLKNLDFIESKGVKEGRSPHMGQATDILPNGQKVKLRQGTPEYLNHIARQDKEFLQLMRDNPEFWRRIKNGDVQLNNVVSVTNTSGLGSTTYKSTPFTLEQRTIDHIDAQL